ncbi:MurR/RpiR family transcriptional regulator [Alishewanella sp. SMS8]|uniref:MurR/RpiR family transcriptional regulator n=1 Tax=Alishewanella sp. SMS8 TaxID=2994676 RepID=UPI0027427792|nr:MurR/RpiR family transcriptional regulator [Alishewanella sp. SMS8]MDP5207651.1 MurR/RpiR family transcriptional regulator [Alishewanella sp. SMS9]MDP5460427.1 MurR/RpiR family transcriptional regulator [Alishewanella sp. SMS8]
MAVLQRIALIQARLRKTEQAIADFVMANPQLIRQLSSQELAQQVGVSQATVVRFSQKLGYKGYPDFKFAVNDTVLNFPEPKDDKLHGDIALDDSYSEMARKLLAGKIAVLTHTLSANDQPLMEQVCRIILQARRIMLTGKGASFLVAQDFCLKLRKLGMNATAESDNHIQLAELAHFGSKDVLFMLSESGETPEMVAIAHYARSHKLKLLSLTGFAPNTIAKLSAVNLKTMANESAVRLSSILSRNAQELVIDLLFILLTQSSAKGRKMLAASNAAVSRYRDPNSSNRA